jgi:hypothetical protein
MLLSRPRRGLHAEIERMMRRFLVGLAILTTGAVGLIGTAVVEQLLTNQVLGPWHSVSDWAPLMQVILMAPVVLPPVLVAWVLLPRGRTTEVGLFLLGWGCVWPVVIALWAIGTVTRLLGGEGSWIGLESGPAAIFMYLFFTGLPLAGIWFLTAGLRQRRAHRRVSQT